ncbi:hypothetical protein HHK36_029619 [Tetracentron sinense]|uniref:Uncharacterized protein n=1 Tax=Tetracentron sinense TaxID=13715 RepID=A0A835CZW8_TETSI|nr:hypothetical protein HHK36_029619 [Tetracentron sinense]
MQSISSEGVDLGPLGRSSNAGEKKATFDVKLEKFDSTAKIKLPEDFLLLILVHIVDFGLYSVSAKFL